MAAIRNLSKADIIAVVFIFSVSAVIANVYFTRVERPNLESRIELHSQIIEGKAPPPYRYRIFAPLIAEISTKALSVVCSYKVAFLLSYAMYDLLAIIFMLVILFVWLKNWFSKEQALIGVLFLAGTMSIALQNHSYQPWSLLETGLFSAALLAIYSKRYWMLAFLVMLASLNKETAIFIPLAFLLTSLDIKSSLKTRMRIAWKPIILFSAYLLEWAVIFLALRYFLGSVPYIHSIEELLAKNLASRSLFYAFVNGSLFLGGFWVFAILGYRYAPSFIRQVALMIPFYLIVIAMWGVWYEVRLLMPLYPVLLPLGLSFVYRPKLKTNAV